MHVVLSYDARNAVRRKRATNKIKYAVNMEDYREVFPQDENLCFLYNTQPGAIFLAPY